MSPAVTPAVITRRSPARIAGRRLTTFAIGVVVLAIAGCESGAPSSLSPVPSVSSGPVTGPPLTAVPVPSAGGPNELDPAPPALPQRAVFPPAMTIASFRAVTNANGDSFMFADGATRQIVMVAFDMRGPMDTPPACN